VIAVMWACAVCFVVGGRAIQRSLVGHREQQMREQPGRQLLDGAGRDPLLERGFDDAEDVQLADLPPACPPQRRWPVQQHDPAHLAPLAGGEPRLERPAHRGNDITIGLGRQ